MDAFFASVEERNNPHFKGKPIAVGSDPMQGHGRGVVSTANYKAREYGIHSALPISKAWQLSEEAKKQGKPEVIFLTPDFPAYEKASQNVLGIIRKYSKTVEPASIDEFYFDLSLAKTFKKAGEICKKIKEEIRRKEKITCSVGIGPNKLISKIAAGERKPDGLVIVPACAGRRQEDAEKFLEPLPIRKIPGIGPKTEEIFQKMGIGTVKELKKISIEELHETLGKHGEDIYWKARGVDESAIEEFREVKSIGEQETFLQDTSDAVPILEAINKMCGSVFKTFREHGFTGFKTIVVIVRFSNFQTTTFSHTLKEYFGRQDLQKFKMETVKSILPFLDHRKNPQGRRIRLLGVRIEKLK